MAGKAEVDLFVRSYQTLLRSTGEVRVAGLLEPYLAMDPTLHSRARNPQPDAAALTYVGLRLPPSMPDVRLVLLSTSIEAIQSRGYDLTDWQPQTSPARRRRQLYDGGERVAILVSSPSDLDDLIPALVAYEIEWNKGYELFSRDAALRRLVERADETGPQPGDDDRLREALGLSPEELARLSIVWQGNAWRYLAQVAEVEVSQDGDVRVRRIVCAVDCGIVVNPDTVHAQIESAIVFGLSGALYGEITLKDGRVEQSNFSDYRVLRINETPAIEVHIVKSTEAPGGMGEPGTSCVMPALANAIFAATGKRIRKLPVANQAARSDGAPA